MFVFKSFEQILIDEVAKFLSSTGVNDLNDGSVMTTFLEASAQEDAQQYYQMYQIIRNYNLDTTEGTDLDKRAGEYKLIRVPAQKATNVITITDSAVTRKATKLYAGNRGPIKGQTYIFVDDANGFPTTGTIIIGRNTANVETIAYTLITDLTNFYRIDLGGGLASDHGTDENVVLSHGGDRNIPINTIVKVPASDESPEISYLLNQAAVIYDGESQVENVPMIAINPGIIGNVPAGTIIEFDTKPFPTATVSNPYSITNGKNKESDPELRDRIKDYIQSLSRGTKKAIISGITGIVDPDDQKRVVSSSIIEPVTLDEIVTCFIDDGTGFEPSFNTVGLETVLESATGGEQFLQIKQFPVIKAEVISQNAEPYAILGSMTLTVAVNDIEETIIFEATDFEQEGLVTAYEVAQAVNRKATLIEARTTSEGTKVVLRAKALKDEKIMISGGTANDANILNFPMLPVESLYLYKYSSSAGLTLLSKDGKTAEIESGGSAPFNLVGGETLAIIVDGKSLNPQTVTFQVSDFAIPGAATAREVAARINSDAAGILALTSENNIKVLIASKTTDSSNSKILILGGTANVQLLFDTTEITGIDKGYSFNRFNGQVELETLGKPGEKYTAGSLLTRATVISGSIGPYVLADFDAITLLVDDGASIFVFHAADYADIMQATPVEICNAINRDIPGCYAEPTTDNRVSIRTNTWKRMNSGTDIGIRSNIGVMGAVGTGVNLGFDIGTIHSSLAPHVASVLSEPEPFAFDKDDLLMVIMDNDTANNTYSITMGLGASVIVGDNILNQTLIGSIDATSENFDIRFLNKDDLKGFKLAWTSGANNPTVSVIDSYDQTTGLITLVTPLANPITVGDTFSVIPVSAKNVAIYLNNTINSSLPVKAIVESTATNFKVQISSKTTGSTGAVKVAGGTANGKLNFSTSQVIGVDAYKDYMGMLKRVQWYIDGLDSDFQSFPGLKAAGIQIEVLPPTVRRFKFEIVLSLKEGITLPIVIDKATSAVSSYVNGLKVGEDVILSEIIDKLMDIDGITDVSFITPTSNTAIADNEVPRVSDNMIIFSTL